MKTRRFTSIALLMLFTSAVGCRKPAATSAPVAAPAVAPAEVVYRPPSRVVLFIGDGMGIGQVTAGAYLAGKPLQMLEMPSVGFMTTHEYEFLTTDSAASATAISTGRKASYEAVSVSPGTTAEQETDKSRHMQTLLELASEHGLRTGMVSTNRINHATPAAFAAHRANRESYEDVAADIASSQLDVLIGPGSSYFNARKDGRDLLAEMQATGWSTATSVAELDALPSEVDRVAALLAPKDYPFLSRDPSRAMGLPDMVSRAIELLDRNAAQGWVLMVEGSFVDWCAHDLDGACAAVEVLDLDEAVGRARAYASDRDDTLVVVTADHETGGMAVIDPYYAGRFAEILGGEEEAARLAALHDPAGNPVPAPLPFQHVRIGGRSAQHEAGVLPNPGLWGMDELVDGRASIVMGHFSMASRPFWRKEGRFYAAHTPALVSIHAEGPGAGAVTRARDNAELGRALRELVVAGALGESRSERAPVDTRPRNVILLVGDGMGVPVITAAHYWAGGLRMLDVDAAGLVSTHALDYLVNDSAASATALATGQRTRKKSVGQIIVGGERAAGATVVERAEEAGLATGIVTTTTLTHATPAAFYAHRADRYDIPGILDDLVSLPARAGDGPEVMLGGGGKEFDEATRARLAAAGYTVTTTWPPTEEGPRLLGLFGADGVAPAADRFATSSPQTPTLAAMTQVAIDRLSGDPDGFFLLVEGGQIDWMLHDGVRDERLLAEVVDFDLAVAAALEFAAGREDTLVIVTADHDHTLSILDDHYAFESGRCGVSTLCGGPLALVAIPVKAGAVGDSDGFADATLQGSFAPPKMFLQYAWPVQEAQARTDVRASHSANFVPLFAQGPWAHRFARFIDQPAIGAQLHEWVDQVR